MRVGGGWGKVVVGKWRPLYSNINKKVKKRENTLEKKESTFEVTISV